MKYLNRLFAHYTRYHSYGPMMLRYLSLVGVVGLPLFYLLRFTRATPSYDDLLLRVASMTLCLALILKERWPARLQPFYFQYSYFVVLFSLPFMFVFTALKNGGGATGVANTLMAVFFTMLLTDWRNSIAILLLGIGLATGVYWLTEPAPRIPVDYLERLPTLLLVLTGGSLFKFAAERQIRQDFASLAGSIAHEMRNPLSQLTHGMGAIQQALPMPGTSARATILAASELDELYRQVASAQLAVRRGLRVIDMTLAEVSARPVQVADLVHLQASDIAALALSEYGREDEAAPGHVTVDVRCDFVFLGDETSCLSILFNLLRNALYYRPGHPGLQVRITVDNGRIHVRDNGPGIEPQQLASLFMPFGTTGKTGGTGIGLLYCRRAMKMMGGRISCESVPGEFTEFRLDFPVVDEAGHSARVHGLRTRAMQAFRARAALVVDDDPMLRAAVARRLQALEMHVDLAGDGARAIGMASDTHYELLILDLNMPGTDGYAVARALRRLQGRDRPMPCIVAHTSEPVTTARIKTRKVGMHGFIAKHGNEAAWLEELLAARERRELEQPESSLAGLRIVLADDDAPTRHFTASLLREKGAHVTEAGGAHDVLDHLGTGEVCDLLIIDLHMAGMDGFELTRAWRAREAGERRLPVFALTAANDERTHRAAHAAGIDRVMVKPFEPADLRDKLRGLQAPHGRMPLARGRSATAGHPLLNLRRVAEYRGLGLFSMLPDLFLPEVDTLLASLAPALEQRDRGSALRLLHRLEGVSGTMGASSLMAAAHEVHEELAGQQRWPGADWLVRMKQLVARIRDELEKMAPARPGAPDAGAGPRSP